MFVIVSVAALVAVCSYLFIMWVAAKHNEVGFATLIAVMTLVPLLQHYAFAEADRDLFYLVFTLSMTACAVIELIGRALKRRH